MQAPKSYASVLIIIDEKGGAEGKMRKGNEADGNIAVTAIRNQVAN